MDGNFFYIDKNLIICSATSGGGFIGFNIVEELAGRRKKERCSEIRIVDELNDSFEIGFREISK
jgi:hypothetical protein